MLIETSFQHDLFTPYLINLPIPKSLSDSPYPLNKNDPSQKVFTPKYMGNVVIPRQYIVKICLDK